MRTGPDFQHLLTTGQSRNTADREIIIQIKCKYLKYLFFPKFNLRCRRRLEHGRLTEYLFYFYFILFKSGSYQMRLNFLKSRERYLADINTEEILDILSCISSKLNKNFIILHRVAVASSTLRSSWR